MHPLSEQQTTTYESEKRMKRDIKLQQMAFRLVEREVLCCVSSLVDTLSHLTQAVDYEVQRELGISWEDDILPLLEAYDWEGAANQAIDDADLEKLETMADSVGYWSDVIEQSQVPSVIEDEEGEVWSVLIGENMKTFDDEDDADEAARESVIDTIRSNLKMCVTNHEEFCQEFDIDMDDWRQDVYEHYVCTNWLALRLSAKGYITGELCGLTIYARTCTGQSMALDLNMQQIAAELWPEELEGL